jgi:hypothetical protein
LMPTVAIVLLIAGGTHLMMAEASEIQGCPSLFASLGTASGTIASSGLPELGKWMLDRSGSPAHWLGEIYDGKKLREPINVVLVDTRAASVEDAKGRVVEASAKAGYTSRMGSLDRVPGAYSR